MGILGDAAAWVMLVFVVGIIGLAAAVLGISILAMWVL